MSSDTPTADEQLHELPKDLPPGESEPRISSRDIRGGLASIDKTVFAWAFGIIVLIVVLGIVFTTTVGSVASEVLAWLISSFGWLFVLSASAFVVFALWLAFGRYGRIPLARNGEEPEFSTRSWVAMMFSAGMGIGLMFYGVYEPVSHLAQPSPFTDAAPGSQGAARAAMAYTLFHWGLHPWAMYAVVGLALAYSTFRMGRGNLMSSPFQAIFGKERIETKGWGKVIDVVAIITTKFGSATSLGLGALQIAAGIELLRTGKFNEHPGAALPIIVILVLTVGIVLSAASGVSRGIKWLSNTNMVVAFALVVFVFVAGPTIFMLNLLPTSIGAYLTDLVPMSFHSGTFGGHKWLASWTIFYWAWWISWTPFVGTFIARISKGRTIREFVLGVMLVPTAVSALWFVVFGGAGIKLQLGGLNIAGKGDAAAGFFAMLQHYPFFVGTAIVVMFLTAIFFVSGADAGALVLATLSSKGRTEPWDPLVTLWAVLTGVVAIMLLLVGGLGALQTFTIIAASPFVLVLIGLCISLYVDLRRDPLRARRAGPVRVQWPVSPPSYSRFHEEAVADSDDDGWSGEPAENQDPSHNGERMVPSGARTGGAGPGGTDGSS